MSFFEQLAAEFPRGAISWRAQTVTKDGTKAMALAYIDARDVMDRLDAVCGPENWQDRYEFHGARTVCYLSIRVDGEWITKADGAGDSDVEAEKGAISDALKRSAVKWGIGRYLYHLESPWVPCEVGQNNKWKRWTANPWDFVRSGKLADAKPQSPKKISAAENKRQLAEIDKDLLDCHTVEDVKKCAAVWKSIAVRDGWTTDCQQAARDKFNDRRDEIAASVEDDIQDQFPGSQIVNETHKEAAE